MPAWYRSSDWQTAKDEIELEIKTRGWDLLSRVSSKVQLDLGEDQRRQFTIHLQCQYPTAQKNTAAWLKFIRKITGKAKQWKSASTAYTQAVNQTHNRAISDTRFKQKPGAGLSEDALKEPGLELTPAEEKLVARQVTVLCVCAHVMTVVRAWVCVCVCVLLCFVDPILGKSRSRCHSSSQGTWGGRIPHPSP